MIKKKKPFSEDQARMKLADLCARSEQCESDLRKKLRTWGLGSDESDNVISALKRGKFLDNARYARAFARDKARFSRWGRRKIALGLAAKRISSADITQGLEAIEEEEYREALVTAATVKARTLDLTERAGAQKLYAHLLSRGYESNLASEEVRHQIRLAREESRDVPSARSLSKSVDKREEE